MELYKELALKCKIEENSKVIIPDEPLKMFTRLVIMDERNGNTNNSIVLGYTSGLIDGSGQISIDSVQSYYNAIKEEIKKIYTNSAEDYNYIPMSTHFGVDIEYKLKPVSDSEKTKKMKF